MSETNTNGRRVLVIGGGIGGIGGLAAALALARQGIRVQLLEQAAEIREIGASIQLAANALDALGVGEAARHRAVFTDYMKLMDALDAKEVVRIDIGAPYRARSAIRMR
jgi:2-polyprenyl-6-methoxyphenol hydroxylase-like FAD-dependent oxidoreductase